MAYTAHGISQKLSIPDISQLCNLTQSGHVLYLLYECLLVLLYCACSATCLFESNLSIICFIYSLKYTSVYPEYCFTCTLYMYYMYYVAIILSTWPSQCWTEWFINK